MIEQELLLLGLLKEGPKHGYDIKLKIKEILYLFAGVDLKSIYYPLRILEKRGLVAKRISKPTKRPERIVYYLTPKGEARFDDLLKKSLLNFKRPQFSLDLSLYFLDYIKPAVSQRRLRSRIYILHKISKGLKQMLKTQKAGMNSSLERILEHNFKMLETESAFLTHLTETIK